MTPKPLKLVLLASVLILGPTAPALCSQFGVAPGDTFDIAVAGFNLTSGIFVVSPIDATFGTTATYPNAGLGGATVTISSSETIIGATTTDTITLSVPVNFLPAGTTAGGEPIDSLVLDIGGSDAGTDTLKLNQAINPATLKTTGFENDIGGTFALIPLGVTDSTHTQLAGTENVGTGPTDADESPFGVNSFTMSFSYTNPAAVPEPTSLVLMGLGGVALLAFRNRR